MEEKSSRSITDQPEAYHLAELLEEMLKSQKGEIVTGSGAAPETRAILRACVENNGHLKMPIGLALQMLEWQCTCGDLYDWEPFAVLWGYVLLHYPEPCAGRFLASRALGFIVAHQLLHGDFKAPEVIITGLRNLRLAEPFRKKAGKPSQGTSLLVAVAFAFLKQKGIEKPSQIEVYKCLRAEGLRVSRKAVNEEFNESLGLSDDSSDAREAQSMAGQRRRRSKVSNQADS